ncbi:MAG TPA: Gfo/Idh/MocA family oxidoreductase [Firmicutes bacterium]|nr:Gfo/Idh/MocA family oxidoreductase [Bacillota bacterium]
MTINWGVIGAGGIAYRRTIPEGIMKAKNARLTAVMDISAERAKAVGEQFGAAWYTDAGELLKRQDVDAVYVATPVAHHYDAVLAAARQGKHVLCEKPLALSLDQVDKMMAVCAEHGVKLGAGYMMRFHGAHRLLHKMLQEGELGQPVLARAQLTCWYPPIPGAWRQDPALGGGGALMDMGTHCLDLLEMLFGPIESVMADISVLTHDYAVDDSSLVLVHFANGAKGIVDNNFNIPDMAALNILEVYGTKGSVVCSGTIGQGAGGTVTARLEQADKGYDARQQRQSQMTTLSYQEINTYQAEVESFGESIENNKEPEISAALGRRNLQVVLACYEAARTGRRVSVPTN